MGMVSLHLSTEFSPMVCDLPSGFKSASFLTTVWRNPEQHSEWGVEMAEPGRMLPMTMKLVVKYAWTREDEPEIEWE